MRLTCWQEPPTMLKLLLGHWQAHREPLPFILTDDPLYCSHLTKSPFPEVYSVNRINPIFEDDENEPKNESPYLQLNNPIFEDDENEPKNESPFLQLKRSLSEERRENETGASDDTGYSSSSHIKSVTTSGSLTDDAGSLEARHMSSDSDDYSQPEAVVVSVDVHRVSYPEDVIVLSSPDSPDSNHTFSANSFSSHYGGVSDSSPEPFDSLTMSSVHDDKQKSDQTPDVKQATSVVREKLQKLLEKGNEKSAETFLDSLEMKAARTGIDPEKTRNDLMKSLNRVLSSKVPNKEGVSSSHIDTVTRTDSALDDHNPSLKSQDRKSVSSSTSPKTLYFSNSPILQDTKGVTRQDESSGSSSVSFAKPRKHRSKHSLDKGLKRGSVESDPPSSDSKKSHMSHKCKVCENAHRPLAFHQLLPGHWSYDNVYVPQISGVVCSCIHHHQQANPPFLASSDDEVFYPLYYPQDMKRTRHSWAPYTTSQILMDNVPKRQRLSEEKNVHSTRKDSGQDSSGKRHSPDGSSLDTDSSQTSSSRIKKSLPERRSLREPKKCKCEHCLSSVLEKDRNQPPHLGSHTCPCHCLSNRKVKFASDTDLSQHRHMHPIPFRIGKDGAKFVNGDTISAALVMNLPHLNGHALTSKQGNKENGVKSKKSQQFVPRGLKEPIKMDELYRTYPINYREWEARYRRGYLQKRRKRALHMVAMAIGIILFVGIAVALTFVFLRIRRTS